MSTQFYDTEVEFSWFDHDGIQIGQGIGFGKNPVNILANFSIDSDTIIAYCFTGIAQAVAEIRPDEGFQERDGLLTVHCGLTESEDGNAVVVGP